MAAAIAQYLTELRLRVQEAIEPQIPPERKTIRLPAAFWRTETGHLLSTVLPFIQQGAEGGVWLAQSVAEGYGIAIDWTMPFTQAADWAREASAELVTRVLDVTKERIRSVVTNWIEAPDMRLPDLWKQLMEDHGFTRYRAELIAKTETTRAYAEGEIRAAREVERRGYIKYAKEWQTVRDSRVCRICAPLQGVTVEGTSGEFETDIGKLQGPPAHPGCRCWINMIPQVA